jgi:hypothetical protein
MKTTDSKSPAIAVGRTRSDVTDTNSYQFDRLSLSILMADMRFKDEDPGPGDFVPETSLTLADGQAVPLFDASSATPTLLVFGSSTCPMTDNAVPGLLNLYSTYRDRVRFLMVNVREAHPGRSAPQPHTDADKTLRARILQDLHSLPFPVAVDDVAGTLHRALGTKPNSAYLISPTGMILFRAHWANDSKAIEAAITSALAGQPIRRPTSGGLLLPMMKMLGDIAPVLDRAGRGAWSDMWRVAPPLAAVATMLSPLRPRRRAK